MTTTNFVRGNFTQLWLKLSSNEELGILDSDYIEDYYGNDGFITLYHRSTTNEYQIAMSEVVGETPGIPNDVFQGVYSPLSNLPDGLYEVRCRVRDVVGNYTILNAIQTPIGGEGVIEVLLDLATVLTLNVIEFGPLTARVGVAYDLSREATDFEVIRAAVDVYAAREGEWRYAG